MSALNSGMVNLTSLTAELKQAAQQGNLSAANAVEEVLTAFLRLLGLLRGSLGAAGGSSSSSKKALAAVDRCQEAANTAARIVREAASRQGKGGMSADTAVTYLVHVFGQLAAELSAELVALGPAEAASAFKLEFPGGIATGGDGRGASSSAVGAAQGGGSKALSELQGLLAGGVEKSMAVAGGAVNEVRGVAWHERQCVGQVCCKNQHG